MPLAVTTFEIYHTAQLLLLLPPHLRLPTLVTESLYSFRKPSIENYLFLHHLFLPRPLIQLCLCNLSFSLFSSNINKLT